MSRNSARRTRPNQVAGLMMSPLYKIVSPSSQFLQQALQTSTTAHPNYFPCSLTSPYLPTAFANKLYRETSNHGCSRAIRKLKRSRCLFHPHKRICDCRSRRERELLQVRIYYGERRAKNGKIRSTDGGPKVSSKPNFRTSFPFAMQLLPEPGLSAD